MTKRRSAWNSARYGGRRGARRNAVPLGLLAGAAAIGALVGFAPALNTLSAASGPVASTRREPLDGCRVTDGDTIRCGSERIRLLGIDAPELPGHCRIGRVCAPGDPYASSSSLADAMVGQLTIERVGEDHYGRTLAMVAGPKGDLSCWQLSHRQAIYKGAWDNGYRVARVCPAAAIE